MVTEQCVQDNQASAGAKDAWQNIAVDSARRTLPYASRIDGSHPTFESKD